jgi:large subunit ribosomal protein L29
MTKRASLLTAIRESSVEELVDRLKRLEEELFQHRLKRYTNQLENTNLIRAARREIARVKTILSGRKHGSEQQAAKQAAAQAEEK